MKKEMKLTPEVKADIQYMIVYKDRTYADIAKKHHLSKSTVFKYVQMIKAEDMPENLPKAKTEETTNDYLPNELIKVKMVILDDFGIVTKQNSKAIKDLLRACRTEIELDRVCHKMIWDKLK